MNNNNNNNVYSTKSGLPLSNIELVLSHMNAKIKMSEFLNKDKRSNFLVYKSKKII